MRERVNANRVDEGFTLIELLVVMIIIGVLAAIAIPAFLAQRKNAVDSTIRSDLKTVSIHIETVFVETQAYPTVSGGADGANVVLAPGADGAPVTVVSISKGNNVTAVMGTNGYCLEGTNPRGWATGEDGAPLITYNSMGGGLGDLSCPAASEL